MNAKRFEPVKVPHVTHVADHLMERRDGQRTKLSADP